MSAVFVGATQRRQWWYELALFHAWHVAAFTNNAAAGKLKSWDTIRDKFRRATAEQPSTSSQPARRQTAAEMMAAMQVFAGMVNKRARPQPTKGATRGKGR